MYPVTSNVPVPEPGPPGRPTRPTPEVPVTVVGGGIAGFSCARVVADAGLAVRVIDRGYKVGGRMAVRHEVVGGVDRRPIDIGASYFTVRDPRFAALAADWRERGLAGVWTDTLTKITPDGPPGTASGQERWSARHGLRSLVEDLARGIRVTHATEVEEVDVADGLTVDGEPAAAVVLAMPEPQAYDLLPEPVAEWLGLGRGLDWSPTIAVWAAWDERWWPDLDGAFVDGSPVLSWIADDGRRRGDGAAVLVAHATGVFAADRLDDPSAAVAPVLAELGTLLGGDGMGDGGKVPEPIFAKAHRWSLASPRHPHDATYALHDSLVGVCGDAWGPQARIEQAWVSGHELGQALVARFGA
jgi:predicted NAD/FAD-dependent oxidoreductase